MQNVKRLVAALVVLMLTLSATWAAPPPAEKQAKTKKDRTSQPITVKSDQLQAYNEAKQAVFIGRVVARQDDVTIYSDRLEVYYGATNDEVDKIIAIGNVRILQTNRVGTGGHAVYESKLGKITLTENPRVSQDTDTVSGKAIIYYLDEERSEVQSGDNARVEAVIHPKSGSASKKNDKKHDKQ
jgi:lipopolysaccharide export system protein LptA